MNDEAVKRVRGAQPGNTNGLKHGFYSRSFHKAEAQDIEALEAQNASNTLEDEILLLKIVIRRVFDLACQQEDNLDTWLTALNTLGTAAARQAALFRAKKFVEGGNQNYVAQAIRQAIIEVNVELKCN
jgi:hypothetical protein